jgi:hypothetical protein
MTFHKDIHNVYSNTVKYCRTKVVDLSKTPIQQTHFKAYVNIMHGANLYKT